jgi:hypothetical protein
MSLDTPNGAPPMNSPILVRVVGKNEATVAHSAIALVPGFTKSPSGRLLSAQTVEPLEALAGVLEDAVRYYQLVRRPSLAKAAVAVRERVIDQITANGGTIPRCRKGGCVIAP